jgi:hypothetical protein
MKYDGHPIYKNLIRYLRFGREGVIHLDRPELRKLMHSASNFELASHRPGLLLYREANGTKAPCMINDGIERILEHAHDGHGHYADAITLDRLIRGAYWPTWVQDDKTWCRSCPTCQLAGPRVRRGALQHIQGFAPLSMIGIDFLGLILPVCSQSQSKYILIAVDYFSRFIWAFPYRGCTMAEVANMLVNHLTPIFGWPKAIYSHNGSHFTGEEIKELFEMQGVTHYTAPITHPSSVGLVERNVQLMMSQLRKRSIDSGLQTPPWGTYVPESTASINTRLIRVHGYSPAQILLGYTPKLLHLDPPGEGHTAPVDKEDLERLPAHQYRIAWSLRSKRRELAMWALVTHQMGTERGRPKPRYTPEPGDLVLVRDKIIDGQKGRKLEARWKGSRLVDRVSEHGLSATIRELYGEGVTRRYHVNDLKAYVKRNREDQRAEEDDQRRDQHEPTIQTGKGAMKHVGFIGEREVFITELIVRHATDRTLKA